MAYQHIGSNRPNYASRGWSYRSIDCTRSSEVYRDVTNLKIKITQMKHTMINGNCLDKLKDLQDNSIDSIVTDPPYELNFMANAWDRSGIAFNKEVWKECIRVLKPGGHLLSFGGTRTYHRMTCAIEDAGFEIRDCINWIYGSGFPKSHNIGKNIEKLKVGGKANLKVVGTKKGLVATNHNDKAKSKSPSGFSYRTQKKGYSEVATDRTQTTGDIPVYEITNEWEGWGTALKPANEPIVMARKPLSEKTVAKNVLEWGTGGINIDECRIDTKPRKTGTKPTSDDATGSGNSLQGSSKNRQAEYDEQNLGRFPANVIMDEEAGKMLDEQSGETSQGHWSKSKTTGFGKYGGGTNEYNGVGPKDQEKGGASRFFYCPKVSKVERNEGLDNFDETGYSINQAHNSKTLEERYNLKSKNNHPTLKPVKLLTYLIKLITPPGGTVLDPFAGSGSTGIAAARENFQFIGIELDEDYTEIAKARIAHELNKHSYRDYWEV